MLCERSRSEEYDYGQIITKFGLKYNKEIMNAFSHFPELRISKQIQSVDLGNSMSIVTIDTSIRKNTKVRLKTILDCPFQPLTHKEKDEVRLQQLEESVSDGYITNSSQKEMKKIKERLEKVYPLLLLLDNNKENERIMRECWEKWDLKIDTLTQETIQKILKEVDWKEYRDERMKLDSKESWNLDSDEYMDDDDEKMTYTKEEYRETIEDALSVFGNEVLSENDLKLLLKSTYIVDTASTLIDGYITAYGNELFCRVYSIIGNGDYIDFSLDYRYKVSYMTVKMDNKMMISKDKQLEGHELFVTELREFQKVFARILGKGVRKDDPILTSGAIVKFLYAAAGLDLDPMLCGDGDNCDNDQEWIFVYFSKKYRGMTMQNINKYMKLEEMERETFVALYEMIGIFSKPFTERKRSERSEDDGCCLQ